MEVSKLQILKEDERGRIYGGRGFMLVCRNKGSVSAEHSHPEEERILLVEGEIELTTDKDAQIVKAPAKIEIEGDVYHRVVGLTDFKLVEIK